MVMDIPLLLTQLNSERWGVKTESSNHVSWQTQ